MKTKFFLVPIGSRFACNGNVCIKQSNKTAVLEQFGRVFYFGMSEYVCIIENI
jgi:hypothetical protein